MVTKVGTYALRAISYLARQRRDAPVTAAEMGEKLGLPVNYPGKVLQTLARCLLVESNRGRRGGYRLAKPPAEVTLLDILSAVECTRRYEKCLLGYARCPGPVTCPMHMVWGVAKNMGPPFIPSRR